MKDGKLEIFTHQMEMMRMLINFRPLCAPKLKSLSQAHIFRTGDLQNVDERDIEIITTDYNISHYLDLRSHSEVQENGINKLLLDGKLVYRHFPMVDENHYLRKKNFQMATITLIIMCIY